MSERDVRERIETMIAEGYPDHPDTWERDMTELLALLDDPPELLDDATEVGGSILDGIVRGWMSGIGFHDETEMHTAYEVTDKDPPDAEEKGWLKVTLIVGRWLRSVDP